MEPDTKSALSSFSQEADWGASRPAPIALREPVEHVIHGDRRIDHYAWLRKKDDPRVISYLQEENAYADAFMKPTAALQEKLYQEMLGRIQQTDLSVPYVLRNYAYFSRTVEGKQYPIYCRRKQSMEFMVEELRERKREREKEKAFSEVETQVETAATPGSGEEEILLDLNALAEGHSFLGLGAYEVSDDNALLAYSTDTTGYRQYTLEIKDLAAGSPIPFRAERVTSAAWSSDNRTLFYVVEDETTKRSHQLFRHELYGGATDVLVYEERDERFRIDVERTRSGAYLFLVSQSHTTSEVRYLRADDALGSFRLIASREDEHEYHVEHHPGSSTEPGGGIFFIRTNTGGRTFRVVTAPAKNPSRERWHEVIANRPGVMLAGLAAFRTHLVIVEREDGLPYLRIVDLMREAPSALTASRRIEFSEPAYNASLGTNPEFDTAHVRFQYESFVTPRSVYDYDVATGERILRKQQPVLGGYNPSLYGSERLHAIAPDGTRVPLSVVFRHDTPRDSSAPLLLYGYGSYGLSMPVSYSSNRLSLLDRGVIFVIAHIRGGGELGKPWHDAGRLRRKLNTFTDFIAAAEHLIEKKYTAAQNLIIEGGSAGGLLMGAVTNLRPDLFRMVITHVPFVDVLNTMLDATLPLTVGEYEEWGNPQVEEDYFYMKQYCPYTNLARKNYPAMLVKTGLNDSQVMYWEPAKYVAKLRTMKTNGTVLALKTNMGAGHGGASGRYDYLREIAFDYAFLLRNLKKE